MRALLVLIFILITTLAQADDLKFQWTQNPPGTEGYRMYMDSSSNVVLDNIPFATTTASISMSPDGKCHNFWLRAYAGAIESGNSDIAVWCPATTDPPLPQPPVNVGGFKIEITVTPTQ